MGFWNNSNSSSKDSNYDTDGDHDTLSKKRKKHIQIQRYSHKKNLKNGEQPSTSPPFRLFLPILEFVPIPTSWQKNISSSHSRPNKGMLEKEKGNDKERQYSYFHTPLFFYLNRRYFYAIALGTLVYFFHFQLQRNRDFFQEEVPTLSLSEISKPQRINIDNGRNLQAMTGEKNVTSTKISPTKISASSTIQKKMKTATLDDDALMQEVTESHKLNHIKAIHVKDHAKYNSLENEYLPDFTLPKGVSVSDMVTVASLRKSLNVLGTVFDVDSIIERAKRMSPKDREEAWHTFELSSGSFNVDDLHQMTPISEEESEKDEHKLTREEQEKKKRQREKRAADALLKETKAAQSRQNKKRCLELQKSHNIINGKSWGTLDKEGQKEWKQIECDWHLLQRKPLFPQYLFNTTQSGVCPSSNLDNSLLYSSKSKDPNKQQGTTLRSTISNLRSSVKKGFTTLSPLSLTNKNKGFSASFESGNMTNVIMTEEDSRESEIHRIPMVSIMAGITTKGIPSYSLDLNKLAVVMHLIPSIMRMAECGFSYNIILGFDAGDQFFDSSSRQMELFEWFLTFIYVPLLQSNINIQLTLVRVNNRLKKPGPVFLEMAKVAFFNFHSDFYYRVNDDTELSHPWTSKFANAIIKLGFPYGAIGPLCREGNTRILTHDFVHATHIAIMDYEYYPTELVDWWMDDWISRVYGSTRTIQAKDVEVLHHTTAHGRRYEVDKSNAMKLDRLVHLGKAKIHAFMEEAGLDANIIKEFVNSEFDEFILYGINGERGPILNKASKARQKKTTTKNKK